MRGLDLKDEDVASGKVQIIAPVDFMDFTVAENVFAGNAMNRRLFYQYGLLLPVSPHGFVTQGLGHKISAGATGLIAPTRLVSEPIEEFEVDGVRMIFQNTPNTEAPREMNTYFPDMKALWMAENVTATLHNIYTLRGAQVRDPLRWSKYINEALHRFGKEAEVMFASHHWPRWGNERIREVLRDQRDLYAHMNNQVLHFANQGVTINQIHNVYRLPESILQKWHCRGYHGSPEHNSRGVIQRFLGFWDCNPGNAGSAVAGRFGTALRRDDGRVGQDHGARPGAPQRGQVSAGDGDRQQAGAGRTAERGAPGSCSPTSSSSSATSRRTPACATAILSGAYELRSGIPQGEAASSSSPDVIRAMSTELFLNFLGIRMDSRKAEGLRFTMNLITPDNGEKFIVELENATLTNIQGFQADKPGPHAHHQPRGPRTDHDGRRSRWRIRSRTARPRSRAIPAILAKLAATMVDFDPRFEVMPGTRQTAEVTAADPFEALTGKTIAE